MQTKHLYFFIHIWTKGEVGAPKPSSKMFLLTVPRFVNHLCYFCLVFVMLSCASAYWCLLVTCWERADLLALVGDSLLYFCYFPMWYPGSGVVLDCSESRPWWYKTWVQSQAQNKPQWLAACGHVSASSQSLGLILSLRIKSSFLTLRPDLCPLWYSHLFCYLAPLMSAISVSYLPIIL